MAAPPRSVLGAGSFLARPPDPARFNNWREYAAALSAFTADSSKVREGVQPEAIQLIHIDTTGQQARTVADGLMVFDPVRRGVMVSIDGEWLPLYAGIAYGSMRMDPATAPVAGPNITTAWGQVVAFNETNIPPFDMVMDPVNNWFSFERPGLYQFAFGFNFQHNNNGSARELDLRFRNLVTSEVSNTISVPTGANDRTSNAAGSVLILVDDADLNQNWIMEVSAPLTSYTSVLVYGVYIQAARINYAF
jgi:hypothetical protein